MDRRMFLGALAASPLAAPLTAEAQQAGRVYTVGILANELSPMREAFRQRLKELSYVEGQNIVFEYRWSAGQVERFHALAAELVGLKVEGIVRVGDAATGALKRATATVPIVMATSGDPVDLASWTHRCLQRRRPARRPCRGASAATPARLGAPRQLDVIC